MPVIGRKANREQTGISTKVLRHKFAPCSPCKVLWHSHQSQTFQSANINNLGKFKLFFSIGKFWKIPHSSSSQYTSFLFWGILIFCRGFRWRILFNNYCWGQCGSHLNKGNEGDCDNPMGGSLKCNSRLLIIQKTFSVSPEKETLNLELTFTELRL